MPTRRSTSDSADCRYLRWTCCLAGVCLLLTAPARSADAPTFKSSTVRAARAALDTSIGTARREFDEKFKAAQKKYADALTAAIEKSTRDGDLEEANKMSLELQTVTAAPYAGSVPGLAGTWRMRWGPNGFTNYTFSTDGRVVRDLPGEEPRGVLRRSNNDLILDFNDRSLMRVNLAGERLFLEYWENPADFPKRYPNQVGMGERAPE